MRTLICITIGLLSCLGLWAILFWGFELANPHLSLVTSPTCNNFKTQFQAQRLYQSNPTKYSKLDRDHDGRACQNLK